MTRTALTTALLATVGLVTAIALESVAFQAQGPTPAVSAPALAQALPNPEAFIGVGHEVTGAVTLETIDGQPYVVFDDAFTTEAGPDLLVVLHRDAIVPSAIAEGDYVSLGDLVATTGSQRYLIPADVDAADYAAVSIWCREYNVTFSYAPLPQ
ncbi:MAG: DM13 domain-containing protein [Cyanobacteria bacterium]|nr:DM13 domain-containing protein [Cyanobacteriota bacterium]